MKENNKTQVWYNVAKRVAVVAAVFAIILSVLLIVNYIQTKSIDPLNSKALNQLMLQLQENQNDEALKEQIRALDLLAEKKVKVAPLISTRLNLDEIEQAIRLHKSKEGLKIIIMPTG